MDAGTFTYGLVAGLAIAVVYAAITDLRHRKIGNYLTLAIALAAPLLWWSTGLSLWPGVAIQLGMAVLVFIIGAFLFSARQVGGGDVKLLTALALCLQPLWFVYLIVFTALVNGLITMIVAMRHRKAKRAGRPVGRAQVPYAVSVAVGMLCVLALDYGPAIEAGLGAARNLS